MIFHLITPAEWEAAQKQQQYEPASLLAEGFIHFSTLAQLLATANRFYAEHAEMLILAVDEHVLDTKLIFEDLYGHGASFPHLYGPLELEQVMQVHHMTKDESGAFVLPNPL